MLDLAVYIQKNAICLKIQAMICKSCTILQLSYMYTTKPHRMATCLL